MMITRATQTGSRVCRGGPRGSHHVWAVTQGISLHRKNYQCCSSPPGKIKVIPMKSVARSVARSTLAFRRFCSLSRKCGRPVRIVLTREKY